MSYITTKQFNDTLKNIANKTLYDGNNVTLNTDNLNNITGDLIDYNFVDFMKALSYKQPTLTLSHNLLTLVYEKGVTVRNGITITANVVVGSEEIQQIEFFKEGVSKSIITSDVATGGNFNYADGTDIQFDTEYMVVITMVSGKTYNAKLSIKFYNPFFYGITRNALNDVTDTEILSLTKDISNKGNKLYSFTNNNEYTLLAYPKEYGLLTSILDSNKFEYISAFNHIELEINSVIYYVYQQIDKSTTNSFKFNFIF